MTTVPGWDEFRELAQRVAAVEQENQMLKSLMLGHRWLTRTQAMKAIGCSEKTLKRLTDAKALTHRYEGTKPFYEIDSVRSYLLDRKIDEKNIDERVLRAAFQG